MKKRVIDEFTISLMSLFEIITHVSAVDCIVTDKSVLFVVKKGMLRKCLGRQGLTLKRLKDKLKRNVWIVEHSANMQVFIKSLMSNIQIISISEQDNTVYVTVPLKYRGLAIGKEGEIIKRNRKIIKRLYDKKLKLMTR